MMNRNNNGHSQPPTPAQDGIHTPLSELTFDQQLTIIRADGREALKLLTTVTSLHVGSGCQHELIRAALNALSDIVESEASTKKRNEPVSKGGS